jgi:hypothetical protein
MVSFSASHCILSLKVLAQFFIQATRSQIYLILRIEGYVNDFIILGRSSTFDPLGLILGLLCY